MRREAAPEPGELISHAELEELQALLAVPERSLVAEQGWADDSDIWRARQAPEQGSLHTNSDLYFYKYNYFTPNFQLC